MSMFDVLTCSHRRSARTSLADVVQDREGAPVRRVGLGEREKDGRALEAACMQAAAEVRSSAPCRCEWCWGESRCPAGGGALWEGLRQPRGSERCGFGRRRLSDAAAGTCDAQVSFPFRKGGGAC